MAIPDLPPFLVYLVTHQILICTICEHALFTNDLAAHARKHLPTGANLAPLRETLKGLALQSPSSAYVVIRVQQPPLPPLQGLPVRDGFQCPTCYDVFLSEEKGHRHLRATHTIAGQPTQLKTLRACQIQGLQSNRYLFRVRHTPGQQASPQRRPPGPHITASPPSTLPTRARAIPPA